MNEALRDPILRTFRRPLTDRLREKLDAKTTVIDVQYNALVKQGRELQRMERDLARTQRAFKRSLRLLASTDDAHYRADVRDFIAKHEAGGGEDPPDANDDVSADN